MKTEYLLEDERKKLKSCGPTAYFDSDTIRLLLSRLAELRERDRWIACKERLPEVIGPYLTAVAYGKWKPISVSHYEMKFGQLGFPPNVTHWRPLPAPPQEEK